MIPLPSDGSRTGSSETELFAFIDDVATSDSLGTFMAEKDQPALRGVARPKSRLGRRLCKQLQQRLLGSILV